jgi:phage-related protein
MTTPVFTWSPLLGTAGTTKDAVRTAQFGDGYSQAVADGINNTADTWPLTFTGNGAYIGAIKAFLDARAGYQSFYWTPPLRTQATFRCTARGTPQPLGGDTYTLTATFTEVFNP